VTIGSEHAEISENLCTGCNICVKRCPFDAIRIINLPDSYGRSYIHDYGINQFNLFGFPADLPEGEICALIGANGIGKTTILRILALRCYPNFGDLSKPITRPTEIDLSRFPTKAQQTIFRRLIAGDLRSVLKIQQIDEIRNHLDQDATVDQFVQTHLASEEYQSLLLLIDQLELPLRTKQLRTLSGGEMQLLCILSACARSKELYLFDEISTYLDLKERIRVAQLLLRCFSETRKRVVLIEHDLMILDLVASYGYICYGLEAAYGCVAEKKSIGTAINEYLSGYLRAENVRFREDPIVHQRAAPLPRDANTISYQAKEVSLDQFHLSILEGKLSEGEILGIAGPNAIGKTTFLNELELPANLLPKGMRIARKPQFLDREHLTVRQMLFEGLIDPFTESFRVDRIHRPLNLEHSYDRSLDDLSGGELQRVYIARTLSENVDLYCFDEPTAFLDLQERLRITKLIKRFIQDEFRYAILVDHDLFFLSGAADRILLFEGEPGVRGQTHPILDVDSGMNQLLRTQGVTVRRDHQTGRPRVNKPGSTLDIRQREEGRFWG